MDIFSYLIPLALTAVVVVLAFGIYALFRGGDFGRSYSNKLMRLRVVMQAVAIAILMGAVWWRARHWPRPGDAPSPLHPFVGRPPHPAGPPRDRERRRAP